MKSEKVKKLKPSSRKKTGSIPTCHELFDQIFQLLSKNKVLSALFVDCSELGFLEKYSIKGYAEIMDFLNEALIKMKGIHIRKQDIIAVNHPNNEQFFIFLSYKRGDRKFYPTDIEELSNRIASFLNEEIFKRAFKIIKGKPRIYTGYGIVLYNPLTSEEKLLNQVMEEAKKMSKYQKFRSIIRNKEKIQELIFKEEITTVYQPIIDIHSYKVMGYEALTRGPKGSEYENPYLLFKVAQEVDLVMELDRLCKKRAFLNAKELMGDEKIFINSLPASLYDPEFKGAFLKELLKKSSIIPKNVVIEVTERQAIDNYKSFKNIISYYTNLGFAIAIDDAGAGYSSFEAVIELKPDYIKLDISMVRDIHKISLKQEMTRALVNISKGLNAVIIAEGIESNEERNTLIQLGVRHGQGYLFAKPAYPFPPVHPSNVQNINKH